MPMPLLQPVLPTLGVKGLFDVYAPFNTVMRPNVVYTVGSIRTIDEYFADGQEPNVTVYSDNNIAQEEFDYDHGNEIPIIGLYTEGAEWIYIPARYINAYPRMDGVAYNNVSLVVSMPAVQVGKDFTTLMTEIKSLVALRIGVEVSQIDVSEVQTSKEVLVDSAVHENLLETRSWTDPFHHTGSPDNINYVAKVAMLEKQLEEMHNLKQQTDAFIIATLTP